MRRTTVLRIQGCDNFFYCVLQLLTVRRVKYCEYVTTTISPPRELMDYLFTYDLILRRSETTLSVLIRSRTLFVHALVNCKRLSGSSATHVLFADDVTHFTTANCESSASTITSYYRHDFAS